MRARMTWLAALLLTTSATMGNAKTASANHDERVRHVLLLSIDGLHATDLSRYVTEHPHSALAGLSHHGLTYGNARLPANSDSFPGLLALVTGGSPVSHGVFYDVSYDRSYFDPSNTTCAGQPGNTMVFDESIDVYGPGNLSLDTIDPTKLPRRLDPKAGCVPVFPHSLLRTNTLFEVVNAAGGRTAWADKHPAYDLVNGPSGKGVDDLYTPEITNVDGADATLSVVCTADNDAKKVKAIINQIHGLKHDGKPFGGTPTLFGMNFQAVSVGQKLAKDNAAGSCTTDVDPKVNGQRGGYKDGSGTPTDVLAYGLDKTDAAIGEMVQALRYQGIYDRTLIVITAKHGQSPINPVLTNKVGHFADIVAKLPDAGTSPAAAAIAQAGACNTGPCGFVMDDDVALIWLADQKQAPAVAAYLNANAKALSIEQVIAGEDLKSRFGDPAKDTRTPDIIVQPVYGTIYTTSGKKNAEHGGLSVGDVSVGLLLSHPDFEGTLVKTPVATSQVAPTILKVLGLEPGALKAVRLEHTAVLPGFGE